MVIFKKIRWKNFLSTGNSFTEIFLDKSPDTLIVGKNGSGKCVRGSTEVDIQFLSPEAEIAFKKFLLEKRN